MVEPKNIYDDAAFLTGYSRMERFGAPWTLALEQALFVELLLEVRGRRVVARPARDVS
jgi:hypothetical protein